MFFDSWHEDSFLPIPPGGVPQRANWLFLLAAAALISAAVGVILKLAKK